MISKTLWIEYTYVLVDLTINRGLGFIVLGPGYVLVLDGWVNRLVHLDEPLELIQPR